MSGARITLLALVALVWSLVILVGGYTALDWTPVYGLPGVGGALLGAAACRWLAHRSWTASLALSAVLGFTLMTLTVFATFSLY